jgi:hypothetical protein
MVLAALGSVPGVKHGGQQTVKVRSLDACKEATVSQGTNDKAQHELAR